MSVRENLIKAKALIDTPEKWGKGLVGPCPCAIIAVERAMGLRRGGAYDGAEYYALNGALPEAWLKEHGWGSVGAFNDASGHSDVMALFQRAIEAAE